MDHEAGTRDLRELAGRHVRMPVTGTAIAGGAGGAVTALALEPVEVVPAGRVQEGLWGEAGLAEARVHRALVRVQGLLGPEAVRVPVEVGGRGPADRVRCLPYGDAPAEPAAEPEAAAEDSFRYSSTPPGRCRKRPSRMAYCWSVTRSRR